MSLRLLYKYADAFDLFQQSITFHAVIITTPGYGCFVQCENRTFATVENGIPAFFFTNVDSASSVVTFQLSNGHTDTAASRGHKNRGIRRQSPNFIALTEGLSNEIDLSANRHKVPTATFTIILEHLGSIMIRLDGGGHRRPKA
ncbi:hypothetical protein Astex_1510 [Asticcacaulis excentricus CB 48]|uniref:Uncharacterized protein n=1 Tax=Asticcacaulis excentricus (strain ATCC 15261 / DSM 4724 / KCTC 12464 / NCIMB 9791 / VKM B-1370 / CB 48) TaxID=573065 RepID=E8RQ03_ASTEC|nr:hypothetical protein Astex_1510 [Asticcacaulis excentricus CB 48]